MDLNQSVIREVHVRVKLLDLLQTWLNSVCGNVGKNNIRRDISGSHESRKRLRTEAGGKAAALEVTSGLWQNNIACHLTATAPMGEASQRHVLYVVLFSNDKVENLIASMVLT